MNLTFTTCLLANVYWTGTSNTRSAHQPHQLSPPAYFYGAGDHSSDHFAAIGLYDHDAGHGIGSAKIVQFEYVSVL